MHEFSVPHGQVRKFLSCLCVLQSCIVARAPACALTHARIVAVRTSVARTPVVLFSRFTCFLLFQIESYVYGIVRLQNSFD